MIADTHLLTLMLARTAGPVYVGTTLDLAIENGAGWLMLGTVVNVGWMGNRQIVTIETSSNVEEARFDERVT